MRRHPSLSSRTPEAIGLDRVSAFNCHNVKAFFTLLRKISNEILFEAYSMWNVDEIGVITSHNP